MAEVFHYLRFLYSRIGLRTLFWLSLATLSALSEGIGIALFLPLMQTGELQSDSGRIADLLAWSGIQLDFTEILVLIVCFFGLKACLFVFQDAYIKNILTRIVAEIRAEGARKFLDSEHGFASRKGIGFITNAITLEYARVGSSFERCLNMVVTSAFALVYVTIPLYLAPEILTAVLVLAIPGYFALAYVNRIIRRLSVQSSEQNALLQSLLLLALNNYRYLKATLSASRIVRRIRATSERLGRLNYKQSLVHGVTANSVEPLSVLAIAGLLYYHVQVEGGKVVEILFVVYLIRRAIAYGMTVQQDYQKFLGVSGSLAVYRDLERELEGAREDLREGGPEPNLREAIAFEEVSFQYEPGVQVLNGVSLQIPARRTVGFVGPSGSGKSTIAALVCALIQPTTGRIRIGGIDYADVSIGSLRRKIGFVPQESVVFNDTIWNNITLWDPDASEDGVRAAVERAHLGHLIDRSSDRFESRLGDHGLNISGGERQRLSIARELYKDVDLLIFDEATSSLDTQTEVEIGRSIEALKGEKTIILIAHRLSTVKNCDVIYVLEDGHIVERGTYDELLNSGGAFRRMVDLQRLESGDQPA